MGFPGPISSFILPVVWPGAQLTRDALVRRAWLVFLVAGLGVAGAAGLIADEHAIQPALTVSGLAVVLAILDGIRINRPARPWPWRLIALCTLLTTIGIGIVPATGETRHLGQAIAGAGYAAGFGGFLLLIRGRMPGGERSAILDAAILAAGTGVLIWAFGFGPLVVTARQSSIATAAFFCSSSARSESPFLAWCAASSDRSHSPGHTCSPSSRRWPLPERPLFILRWRSGRSASVRAPNRLARVAWSPSWWHYW